jgi:hypothetical protein
VALRLINQVNISLQFLFREFVICQIAAAKDRGEDEIGLWIPYCGNGSPLVRRSQDARDNHKFTLYAFADDNLSIVSAYEEEPVPPSQML